MKKALLVLSFVLLSFSAWAVKIYINPGHGSWSANCRHMGVIPVPVGSADANGYYSGNDTLGFFESNTNLWKGLFLEKKLLEKGYQVKMSRRYSGGTNELESSAYDKALHVIGAESQAYGSDYFISIHSNAHIDGYTTNYPVFIHKGYDNSETNAGSIWGEQILWDHHFKIFSSGMEPYSYYSATNKCIRGGLSMNGWDYGVLRTQSRPGTLVEGYFHTYQPARHRAMQPDWCRQEGLRYFRGFTQMYGTAKDTKGYIMGYVRTKDKQINQTNYTGRAGNDIYYPLNGAKIVLRDASGKIIKTDNYKYVARDVNNQNKSYYTTDNYYNGVFVFDDLTPGTYTISVHCAGYADVKQSLNVTAHETTYTQIFMTAGQGTEPDTNEAMGTSGLNPYAYDLSSSWDETTQKLTMKFSLNADAYVDGEGGYADGIQIYLSDDKANPKKYYVYGLGKNDCKQGQNKSFTIDLSSGLDKNGKELPKGKPLYASITVQGDRSNTAPREYSLAHRVKYPNGIAVDKNPDSKNFGKIFVNEAYQYAQGGELTEYFTKGLAGMYVLDADFQLRNTTRYTGGYDFSWWVIDNTYSGLARKGYQPWCVRVSEDGRIFVCSNDMHQRQTTQNANGERDGVAVWEVDANDFNKWIPVLHGYRRFVSGETGTNYTFSYKDVNGVEQFIGPICGMDVKGTGDDVTLLLYTVNQAGIWLDMNGFRAYEYNVKTGALKPVPAFNNGGYGLVFEYTSLRYGVDGSYWFGGSRADGSDGVEGNGKTKEPNLGHVKLDGTTADYTNYNSEFYGGAGMVIYKSTYNNSACNAANHTWLVSGKDNSGGYDGLFDVFIVNTTDGGGAGITRMDGNSGRPNWQKITASGMGRNLNDMAVDYAENLYIVSSSGGMVRAYAMPYCGEKTTTVREQYAFELPAEFTWHPYPKGYQVTNQDLLDQFIEDTVGTDLTTLLTSAESNWKWLGDYIKTIDATATWEQAVTDFFAAQGAFATAGQPAQWEQKWWNATFTTDVKNGTPMPKVKRHGWALEDWRYGNEDGYYYFSEDSKVKNNTLEESKLDSAHVWVRWLEACLYEGYESYRESGDTSAIDLRTWTLNATEDLLLLIDGKTMDLPIKHSFNTGVYNAISLPFAVSRETLLQVTNEAGNYVFNAQQGGKMPKVYVYDNYKVVPTDSLNELQLMVRTLKADEIIPANTPFLITPQETIEGKIVFHDVTIVKPGIKETNGAVNFNGWHSPGKLTPTEDAKILVVDTNGSLVLQTESATMYGERGYFTVDTSVVFDFATIVPKSSITWHPYPAGYQVTNQDLFDQFLADAAGKDVQTLMSTSWKWLGDYMLSVDTTIVGEAWEQAVADFFAAQGAFVAAGQPEQWEQKWWEATFEAELLDGAAMPHVKRHGWVLEDWRYGNEDGYYYFSESSKVQNNAFDIACADSTHIWARWIEQRVAEGYETYAESADTSAIDLRTWAINTNEDLMTLLDGKTLDLGVTRTLVADKYNTMSLPFAITYETLSHVTDNNGNKIFGDETPEIYLFDLASVVLNSEAATELQLQFHLLKEEDEVPANQAFIIKPKVDVNVDMIFHGVTVAKPTAESIGVDDVVFLSLLAPKTITPIVGEKVVEVLNGELNEHTDAVSLLGLNAYFMLKASIPAYDYAVIKLDNGVSTSVENIEPTSKPIKVMINHGVYIIHGKNIFNVTGQRQ
jgi:N-acetylmuramoyl-L-alanine amidase